jgi:hypothetical protein
MTDRVLERRLRWYQGATLFSVMFALLGFTYNVWRMEQTEHNSSVREASFEMLLQLAELEQLVYAAHYDRDPAAGNPRTGWVIVGLIVDLSSACSAQVRSRALHLRALWAEAWEELVDDRALVDGLVEAMDATRDAVHAALDGLR